MRCFIATAFDEQIVSWRRTNTTDGQHLVKFSFTFDIYQKELLLINQFVKDRKASKQSHFRETKKVVTIWVLGGFLHRWYRF